MGILFGIFLFPGLWLPFIVSHFKQMGDGTGNESSLIEGMLWSMVGALISWGIIVAIVVWAFMHLRIVVV